MLRMRLQRRGKKNYPTYRVVVAERTAPIKGRFVADMGWYNPHRDEFTVNADLVKEWLGKGVQATPTVHNLLITHKVIEGEKLTSWTPKKKADESSDSSPEASAENGENPDQESKEEEKTE